MADVFPQVPQTNLGWIWQRLQSRWRRTSGPCVAIVYGEASNLGDFSLAESLQQSLPGCHLLPFCYPSKERLLQRLRLSGPAMFRGLVLGGGTLINEMGVGPVREALRQGIPVWVMGTGAGQGAYYIPADPDLTEWGPLLQRCRVVGVRGPRSLARLAAVGFTQATLLPDTALCLTPDRLPVEGPHRLWALNVIAPSPYRQAEDWTTDHLDGLVRQLRQMNAEGIRFQPFAMVGDDVACTREVMRHAGLPDQPVAVPRNSAAIQHLFRDCVGGFSMRLHGAVLATTMGVPMILLGYMEKCIDFAESLDLQSLHVPIREASQDRLARARQNADAFAARGRHEIWQRAHRAKQQILAFGEAIQRDVGRRLSAGA